MVEEYHTLERRREAVQACWRQLQESDLLSVLREIYETFKWEYKEMLDWHEEESAIKIRYSWTEDDLWYMWHEFGLKGSESGIVLWCCIDFSERMLSNPDFQQIGSGIWYKKKANFDFETLIDPDTITKNELIECVQYILNLKLDGLSQYSKERKKPSIVPSPPEEHATEEEEKTEKPKKEEPIRKKEPTKKGFFKKLFG